MQTSGIIAVLLCTMDDLVHFEIENNMWYQMNKSVIVWTRGKNVNETSFEVEGLETFTLLFPPPLPEVNCNVFLLPHMTVFGQNFCCPISCIWLFWESLFVAPCGSFGKSFCCPMWLFWKVFLLPHVAFLESLFIAPCGSFGKSFCCPMWLFWKVFVAPCGSFGMLSPFMDFFGKSFCCPLYMNYSQIEEI